MLKAYKVTDDIVSVFVEGNGLQVVTEFVNLFGAIYKASPPCMRIQLLNAIDYVVNENESDN